MPKATLTLFALVLCVLVALASLAGAQQSPSPGPWGGWARCVINVSGQGYSDQQTHTWTISSSTSAVSGAFRVYPATWSVVGGGSLQRTTQGSQTLKAEWATTALNLSAPLAVFVRASDRKMLIQARHSQTQAPRSISGYQQLTIDGKPQKPAAIAAEAFEWAFPPVEVSRLKPTDPATANGSSTPVVNGKVGLMQPASAQATASCTWQFGEGPAAPAAPPAVAVQPVPTPATPATTQPAGQPTGNAPACPGAPRDLAASVSPNGIATFSWSAPPSGVAESYVLQAGSQPGGADRMTLEINPPALMTLMSNVNPGSYYTRVYAKNSCGLSAASNEVQLDVPVTSGSTCASAPRNLTASTSVRGDLHLTWSAPASGVAQAYVIQDGSQPGGTDLLDLDISIPALTTLISDATPGPNYIRVYASSSCGLSGASNEVHVNVPDINHGLMQ